MFNAVSALAMPIALLWACHTSRWLLSVRFVWVARPEYSKSVGNVGLTFENKRGTLLP